jgi:2-phosphosulfolactate phosphatase
VTVRTEILEGLDGARAARGVAVIIDVFRAFSLVPWALARGAEYIVPVGTPEEALALREQIPGCRLAGERDGRPLPGFDYGNSPDEISRADLAGRVLVHRTSAGVQGLLAARAADSVLAASFLTAGATVEWVRRRDAELVSLVAMGWNGREPALEDQACAEYLAAALAGAAPDFEPLRAAIRDDPTGRRFFDPKLPWFPEADFDACIALDRFDFAVAARPDDRYGLRLEAQSPERLPAGQSASP